MSAEKPAPQWVVDIALRELLERVRLMLGDPDARGLSFIYEQVGDGWLWTVRVRDRRVPGRRGGRRTRHGFSCSGATPDLALEELKRRVAVPGWLDA